MRVMSPTLRNLRLTVATHARLRGVPDAQIGRLGFDLAKSIKDVLLEVPERRRRFAFSGKVAGAGDVDDAPRSNAGREQE